MHIYSKDDLYNKHVQNEASEVYLHKGIAEAAYKNILETYSTNLYTPNYFIRIALAVLTLVAIIFSGLLFGLIFQMAMVPTFLFFAFANYIALEILVRKKWYFDAGVDNLLMFFSAVFFTGAFVVNQYPGQDLAVSGIAIVICLYLSIRFVDAFMATLGYLALLVFIFLLFAKSGPIAKAAAPFLLMFVSVGFALLMKRLIKNEKMLFYRHCCRCVLQVTLLTLYASCNYFIVRELSNEMFGLNLAPNDPISLGWLFWVLTFVIPVAYVVTGVNKKDLMFIRTGLILVAASVFTFRYYYHILPIEVVLLVAGVLMIAISYAMLRYLSISKYGFSVDKKVVSNKERIDIKELIIAQVSGQKTETQAGVEFGGGSFGSGGAGGNY